MSLRSRSLVRRAASRRCSGLQDLKKHFTTTARVESDTHRYSLSGTVPTAMYPSWLRCDAEAARTELPALAELWRQRSPARPSGKIFPRLVIVLRPEFPV